MLKEVTVLIVFAAVSHALVPKGVKPNSREMADYINSLDTTWKAAEYTDEKFKPSNLKRLFGVRKGGPSDVKPPVKEIIPSNDLPATFDAREKWKNCPSLNRIRDQSNCGSCWAVATAEAITDRTCIASDGKFTDDLSAEDILACCFGFFIFGCGQGCNGGFPPKAWEYWVQNGLVTGGNFNGTGCYPYSINPKHKKGEVAPTPKCEKKCKDGREWTKDKHFGAKSYAVANDENQIKQEILDHGPVGAGFIVYSDFTSYKSGVYQAQSTEQLGRHAVKILGWGEENGTPYWLVANSWNEGWGDAGFFKILRGANHCNIETDVLAGIPK